MGIDANRDGALDLFVGVNNSGAADTIGLWNPGNGANTSPNTTSIVSTPLVSYTQNATNYHWAAVNTTIDPIVGTATDIDGGGQTDRFLSFGVPFNDVVTQLAARGVSGIDENSSFSYVMATATQANSLNQDLNGIPKTYDGAATWSTLGALADPLSASGVAIIPEINPGIAVAVLAMVAIARQGTEDESARLAAKFSFHRRCCRHCVSNRGSEPLLLRKTFLRIHRARFGHAIRRRQP